jgi:hypothetical protein
VSECWWGNKATINNASTVVAEAQAKSKKKIITTRNNQIS